MKGKTTLTLDEEIWRTFRAECIRRGVSASRMVQAFMATSLKRWGVEAEGLLSRAKKR